MPASPRPAGNPPCRLPAVALEFRHNTNGKVGREDFAWVVQHVMGIQLRSELVGWGWGREGRAVD